MLYCYIAKNMLNIKNLYDLQKNAREMQKTLANESVEVEEHGIKILMNGNQEILSIEMNSELSKEDAEKYLKEAFNAAIKKVQQRMAQKMIAGNF